jgi:hypothetical protein
VLAPVRVATESGTVFSDTVDDRNLGLGVRYVACGEVGHKSIAGDNFVCHASHNPIIVGVAGKRDAVDESFETLLEACSDLVRRFGRRLIEKPPSEGSWVGCKRQSR